uniref:Uncharacterized protein n=1 Tax=Hucho hucho TaxID=62062 RepID=A0A4W5N118_9TELE
MRTATLILLCNYLICCSFKSIGGRSEKYLCRGKLMQSVRIKHIQKLEVKRSNIPSSMLLLK